MFPVRSVTYVPGLYPAVRSPRLLTASVGRTPEAHADPPQEQSRLYLDKYFRPLSELKLGSAVSRLEALLRSDDSTEAAFQRYIADNAYLLLPLAPQRSFLVVSQARLDDQYVVDFAMYGEMNVSWWTFVEIEPPQAPLFTRSGDPSREFTHALQQTYDWRQWRESSSSWARVFGDGIAPSRLHTMVLIGRRGTLDHRRRARLKSYGLTYTYDSLLDVARSAGTLRPDTIVQANAIPWSEFKSIRGETRLYNLWGDFERITGTQIYARVADFSEEVSDTEIAAVLAEGQTASPAELADRVVEIGERFSRNEHISTPGDPVLVRLIAYLHELKSIDWGHAREVPRAEVTAYQRAWNAWGSLADHHCADRLAHALEAKFGDRANEVSLSIQEAVQSVDIWHHEASLACQSFGESLLVPGWCEPERNLYAAELAILRAGGIVVSNLVINRRRATLAVLW